MARSGKHATWNVTYLMKEPSQQINRNIRATERPATETKTNKFDPAVQVLKLGAFQQYTLMDKTKTCYLFMG